MESNSAFKVCLSTDFISRIRISLSESGRLERKRLLLQKARGRREREMMIRIPYTVKSYIAP